MSREREREIRVIIEKKSNDWREKYVYDWKIKLNILNEHSQCVCRHSLELFFIFFLLMEVTYRYIILFLLKNHTSPK